MQMYLETSTALQILAQMVSSVLVVISRVFSLLKFQLIDIISVSGECMHFDLKKLVNLLQVEHPLCQLFWLVLVVQQLKRA